MYELWVCNLNTIDYRSALALQEGLRAARQEELIPDVLLLLEHDPPVYTRGRRSEPGELSMGPDWYAAKGISIISTQRGGKVTYHGPGQLVGYGIVAIDEVLQYVRMLERSLIAALADEGITARNRPDEGPAYTGVWVQERKIASIGVHVAHGVTAHGFAINIDNDLAPFDWVVACGLPDVSMTSVVAETGGVARVFGEPVEQAAGGVTPERAADGVAREPAEPAADAREEHAGAVVDGQTTALVDRFRTRIGVAIAAELGLRRRVVSREQLERYVASLQGTRKTTRPAVTAAARVR